jgi:ribosome-associated protein
VKKRRPGTPNQRTSVPRSKPAGAAAKTTRKRGGKKNPAVFGPYDLAEAAPPVESERHRESRDAALAAIAAALEKKALMPILLDVGGRATYTDFIGVVSGRSDRQVDAIATNVREAMEQRGWRLLGREGAGNGRWTLLDFGDVVVHVFYHPVREIYDIEGLWIDAPRVQLQIPPEAQLYQSDALYGAL